MHAEINDVINPLNDTEFQDGLASVPILVSVDPPEAAPGDLVRLDVFQLFAMPITRVALNGYPAEITAFDPRQFDQY